MSANVLKTNDHAKSLANNKSISILKAAEQGKYGVVAVCCYNLEEIVATCRAAEAKNSPAMVLLFPWAMQQFGSILVNMAAETCRSAKVPVALHLDHCQDVELVKYAATLPFDSIMVDMSHYEKEENLRLTRELTELCHERGIATEAEPGRIEGGEDGVKDTAELEGVLTTPEEALEFMDTGIDFLAPSFGNIHGEYGPRGPKAFLQFDRLRSVQQTIRGRGAMVLHGSGDFTEDLYQECIQSGVSKINVNVQLVAPWHEKMLARKNFLPLTRFIEDSISIYQEQVELLIDMFGSEGKA